MQYNSHTKTTFWLSLFLSVTVAVVSCKSPEMASMKYQTTAGKFDSVADKLAHLPGTYTGIIPCEGCEGIVTTLVINGDGTYALTRKFLKGDEGTFEEQSGRYVRRHDGRSIELTGLKDAQNLFFVEKDLLIQAGPDGSRMTGSGHALQKEVIAGHDAGLLTGKWKLTELMGKPVPEAASPRQQIQMTFDFEAMRVSGSAGCNQYFGTFEIPGNGRIRFSKIGATMMACPEPAMAAEQEFLQMLEMVDNYAATEKTLSLHKARMAPFARFEKAE